MYAHKQRQALGHNVFQVFRHGTVVWYSIPPRPSFM